MRVTLLGPVAAASEGRSLPLGGRKQRAVFALLALDVNRPVALDRLVHEVWRDEPPARATLALQAYISRLRRVLADAGPEQARSEDSDAQLAQLAASGGARIVTRRPGWLLQMPAQQVDSVHFGVLVDEGRVAAANDDPSSAVACLRAALALWSGEPLADLSDTGIAVEAVGGLNERRLEASELLWESELAVGSRSVVAAARDFLTEHPFRERAWRALILGLYRDGRQAEALAAVHDLRRTLSEELGLDPSPDVQRLEAQILRHDPALDRAPPRRVVSTAPAFAVEPLDAAPGATGTDSLVVGREHELSAIVAAVHAAHQGTGRLVVVEGPAGIGKTTLLQRLENSVHSVDGIVLRGAGVGPVTMPALWPWVTIFRQLREAAPALAQAALDGPIAAALGALDPSIGDDASSAAPSMSPALARTHLCRAVVDLLGAVQAERSVAVVIDDAQWVDHDSLDLFALAATDLLPRGALFAIAYRPDEAPGVRDGVADLAAQVGPDVVRLPLAGLTSESVEEIVTHLAGGRAPDGVSEAITDRSVGNPFFVVELVRLLASEHRLDRSGVYSALPDGVRNVIRRRLDRLPEQTLNVLNVLAVLGRPASPELLASISRTDEDAVLVACEAGVLVGLVVDDAGEGEFALVHDLVRQTLDDSLSAARRIRLHARIGAALAAAEGAGSAGVGSSQRVVEIAHHLTIASPVVGAAAVPYLLAAADDALARIASGQAAHFLSSALDVAGLLPDAAQRSRTQAEIRARLTTGRLIVPGLDSSREQQVLTGPTTIGSLEPDDPAAWYSSVLLLIACGDNAGALAAAQAALHDALPPAAALAPTFTRGLACFELGLLDDADASLSRAETLIRDTRVSAETIFDFAGTATVLRACVAALRGEHDRAEQLVLRARATPNQTVIQLVTIEFWSAWCAVQAGDLVLASSRSQACIGETAELGDTFYAASCRLILGWATALGGDETGLASADAAYEEYGTKFPGLMHQRTVQLLLRAEAYSFHREPERAGALVREARELAAGTGESTLGVRLSELAERLVPAS